MMRFHHIGLIVSLLLPGSGALAADAPAWSPQKAPLMTRWAKDVSPEKVHPEYPRPQMVRKEWQNLNGLWEYAIKPKDDAKPAAWDGKILVPFPVESALSGVMKPVGPANRLWYRRTFTVPEAWKGQRLLLHFGAVDWDATVTVNGKEVGSHRGGYDPFSFDVTDALKDGGRGEQEIVVSVWDPSDANWQPRGKQIRRPHGIWYTPITGIWQTVWMEPVPKAHIASLQVTPDIDTGRVTVKVNPVGADTTVVDGNFFQLIVLDGDAQVGGNAGPNAWQVTTIQNPKLWSPDSPHLYKITVRFGEDSVESYFAMRKISLGKDDKGITRLMLNNKPLFQYGPLDQGFWPDGLYTAPTDEALRYDLEVTKKLGFNMVRKHVKTEPARWYHHCDKLGLLVWQDMPSGDRYIRANEPDIVRSKESAENFEREWKEIVTDLSHFPCIVMWVPFNEGWGQFDTQRIVDLTRQWDPTRLVNNASGWADRAGVGDVIDWHVYPGPGSPKPEETRAAVLGEFGGLGLPLEGHTWLDKGNWGYRSYTSKEALTNAYVQLLARMHPLIGDPGLSAAVYTQTTDVEIEVNGLMTYDRAVMKMDADRITEAAKRLFQPPPRLRPLVAASQAQGQAWRYTEQQPAEGWMKSDFDDTAWKQGPGGFGTKMTPGTHVRTEWKTQQIWIRRTIDLPADAKPAEPYLLMHHDEDAKVYINGVLAAEVTGYTTGYEHFPLTPEARAVLKPGRNVLAVHCKQTGGGQYIDVGLVDVVRE